MARSLTTVPSSLRAGQVVHQLTTAVRSPARAATSQNAGARRSRPELIVGRVSRSKSVAAEIACARRDDVSGN